MKFNLNYNPKELSRAVVTEQLNYLNISFTFNENGQLEILTKLVPQARQEMLSALHKFGITLSEPGKNNIVQNIKQAIEEIILSEDLRKVKVSVYLSERLNYSYSHISNLFSEETYTSIENFIILRKIEYAKRLILEKNMSLTEIAYNLDYSSVAHLSGQFKKVTGLSPTVFKRILEKRKNTNVN